jgi:diguanylate cyclase (GGDEF)-like protein
VTTARTLHKDGAWRWLEYSVSDLRDDPSVRGYVVVARDVTERKNAEEELVHQALHDALTGLPNRALFLDRLGLALSRLERRPGLAAVFFLDLDYFKVVNDSLGHSAGDQVLVAVAARLQQSLRDGDTAARLGGDEFAVLCDDLVDEGEALQIAERLGDAVAAEPVNLAGRELVVTVSIGVAFATHSGQRPESLLRDADAAMYRAKDLGRARLEVFDEATRRSVVHRLEVEQELSHAIEMDWLRALYQPILDVQTGALTGVEALIRYEDPDRGLVLPEEFLAVAEDSGLITRLDTWMLNHACRDARRWRELVPDFPLRVGVNVSARQLSRPDFADEVVAALLASGLEAGQLALEITETELVDATPTAISATHRLRSMGVHVGADDFGTGYSSLAHLKRFPVDFLKVDRSFVDGLPSEHDDATIVEAVIGLGHALGLTVVAEGVETDEQLTHLQALGCDLYQGFLRSVPVTADAVLALLGAPTSLTS